MLETAQNHPPHGPRAPKIESPSEPEPAPTRTGIPGVVDMELHTRRYRARWAQLGTVEQLRVNVRIEAGHNGSAKTHVETLDLYSARSRRVFATRAAQMLGSSVDAIEEDLSELLIAVDHAQRAAAMIASTKPVAEPPPLMNDAERAEALALLRAPDLMDRIARDMDALGYVGEDINKKLGYLIAVSRKLAEPLSAILISQSGAGKSGLAGALERLVPPEDVVFWSRLTPQALYYVEKDFLKRKLVVIEERAGSDAADYSIRALQSKHKLVQAVPVKDPATGSIHTRTMEVEGPAAFIETTTRMTINPENASRCFELYLDESAAQTSRVHEAQRSAKTPQALERRERGKHTERMHQNAQRLLDPVAVAMPFAELLTFPTSWLRTRRDNLRMLNLIEAVAFLHQHQRPRHRLASGTEYIEASIEDYAVAYSLATTALGFGLDELRKPARELLALIESKVKDLAEKRGATPAAITFQRRDVRGWSGLPNHQVKLAMHELEELEYIEVEKAARGSRFVCRLVPDATSRKAPMTGLLTPAQLFNRIADAVPKSAAVKPRRSPAPSPPPRRVEQSGKRPVSTHF
jgi:DNA primase